jgi:hypothetical protein
VGGLAIKGGGLLNEKGFVSEPFFDKMEHLKYQLFSYEIPCLKILLN